MGYRQDKCKSESNCLLPNPDNSQKNIWIWNHYATAMFKNKGGRHYWLAESLQKNGYNPTVFCANTYHNSELFEELADKKYKVDSSNDIPFVFVKTTKYKKNGFSRICNMFMFYINILSVSKKHAEKYGKPDVILASSVHPLTLIAGIQTSKRFKIPCICEIRDLWPESLIAYKKIKKESILAKVLYKGERWIYEKANAIVMTWEGGKEYIANQPWLKHIDINKVHHISNGINISEFDNNSATYKVLDNDLTDESIKNVIYTGSIRYVNNIGMLLDSAKIIKQKGYDNIHFLIYGDGDEKDTLERRCVAENITNVFFKGKVSKDYIPYIVKNAYINILHNMSTDLDKYGQSQNKLFEYLAAGKCILQTYDMNYNICKRFECGVSISDQNPENIAKSIIALCDDKDTCDALGQKARMISKEYDFDLLVLKLIHVIEHVQRSKVGKVRFM